MFHGFPTSSLVFGFFNVYAPPPMTSEIMNGPSHCGASLCTFSCISHRMRSPFGKFLSAEDCFDMCVACPGILLTLLWLCPLLRLRCIYRPVVLLLPLL